jgi:CDP-glucose 4,6-dehydratase
MVAFADIYGGKRVLLTGHTGFKGAWLAEWLVLLGADVTGLSLPPPTEPSLFSQLDSSRRVHHVEADVRDLAAVERVVTESGPDFVFHLAAQPLVRRSYRDPVETYATNVMGTVNVLDAIRRRGKRCAVVSITTDKCYENREWVQSYREGDPMGGFDPYSSSKGAAELVIAAYRQSFFSHSDSVVQLASVRAGNVIGGGDWASDRIVPDCIRALKSGCSIPVRNKVATRPWQHVLEPLSGYLWLGAALGGECSSAFHFPQNNYAGAFNFGPSLTSNRTVAELVAEVLKHWPGSWEDKSDPNAVHEAKLLNLATDKAYHLLQWRPVWDFGETIAHTISWYRDVDAMSGMAPAKTRAQIEAYTNAARSLGLAWAA